MGAEGVGRCDAWEQAVEGRRINQGVAYESHVLLSR